MKITYDKEADAVYIYCIQPNKKKHPYKETKGEFPINLDISKDGKLIGIEILSASKVVDIEYLKKMIFERIDKKS